MNFNDALNSYRADPTNENLNRTALALLNEMTVKERIHTLKGHAMSVTVKNLFKSGRFYNAEPYPAGGCKRLGIPPVKFTDGPRGIVMGKCTCFPVSMLRGATFDDELEYRIGEVFAKEASAMGANLFAGICINLLRNPMWGQSSGNIRRRPVSFRKNGRCAYKSNAGQRHYCLSQTLCT